MLDLWLVSTNTTKAYAKLKLDLSGDLFEMILRFMEWLDTLNCLGLYLWMTKDPFLGVIWIQNEVNDLIIHMSLILHLES